MKEKNFNPTGKKLFVLYVCPNCGSSNGVLVPPKLSQNLPFFIKCDGCGGYLMYHGAYDTSPCKSSNVMTSIMLGEKKYLDMIKNHKFKEYTDQLSPEGTLDRDNLPTIDVDFGPNDEIDAMVLPPKNKNKNKKPVSGKQICPVCGNEFIIKDIDLYIKIMNEAWDVIKKAVPETHAKQLNDEIYKRNHPDAIKKCIKEKGYFTGFCQPCMSKLAWSKQLFGT